MEAHAQYFDSSKPALGQLPPEIRRMIWEQAAINGSIAPLRKACPEARRESGNLFDVPPDVTRLDALIITVDDTFSNGTWLEVQCIWTRHRRRYAATYPLENSADFCFCPNWLRFPFGTVDEVIVEIVGPSRGDFWGRFLMMFAKMADVLAMISSRLSEPNALEAEQYDKHRLVFKTTKLFSGVAASQKNFWDCRCEDKFLDKFHEFLEGWPGKRPCLYEYFLFYTHDVIQAVLATERDISLAFDFESQPRSSSILCGSHRNFIHSPTLLTEWERLGRGGAREVIRYMADVNQKHPTNVMDLIWDAFKRSMQVHYDSLWDNLPLYLDHYAGARGGPLDMLRLHRFISLDKLGMHERHVTDFFVWRAYERFRLGQRTPLIQDAEKHLADSLRYLFAPSATSIDKERRSACRSLASIEWAKEDAVPEHLEETSQPCPSSVWVKAYPRGISLRGVRQKGACRGGNILEWRNKWDIVRQRDRQHCAKTEKLVVRRTWQCLGCCPELKDILCKPVSDRCQYYGLFDKSVSREEKWQDWMLYHGGIDASTDMNITGLSDMLDPDAHFVSRYNTRARTPAFEEDDRAILFHEAYKVKPVEWTGLGQTWDQSSFFPVWTFGLKKALFVLSEREIVDRTNA